MRPLKLRYKMSDESWLICLRVIPGRGPAALSRQEACAKCGEKVWRAYSSPDYLRALCVQCIAEIDPKEEIELMPPTERQRAEIEAYAKRHNS